MTIKIYHQHHIIFLTDNADFEAPTVFKNPTVEQIKQVFFNEWNDEIVCFFSEDFDKLLSLVYSCFKIIEAAGGLVSNPSNDILLMYRRGSWDLPKGKIDDGETKEIAAVREVEEETGIRNIHLHQFITTTYHTYYYKNNWALKPTHWYKMSIDENQELIPQTEEDIEKLEWVHPNSLSVYFENMYPSIKEVLRSEW